MESGLPAEAIRRAVRDALAEDVGEGDVTTLATVPADATATAALVARESLTVAGLDFAQAVFHELSPAIRVERRCQDGDAVRAGAVLLQLSGPARPLLTGERVALNFVQHLSGVATLTARFVAAVAGTRAQILDTRKTTPGLRALEKAAVVTGGGVNHRFGLYDMVLIKDNHLAALGGLSSFADRIRRLRQERPNIRIEVEADDLEQVRAFVEVDGIDVILLDNMTPAQIREAVALRRNNIKFEASGGITLKNVKRVAATGVDYISIGALTNSARAIDIALEMTHVAG